MNQLYQELMGQQQTQQSNNGNFLSRLGQFAQNFKGDPKAQVEQMLKSGQISKEQYNNAVNQANMLYSMLNKGKGG